MIGLVLLHKNRNLREEGAGEMDVIGMAEGREVKVMCICGDVCSFVYC